MAAPLPFSTFPRNSRRDDGYYCRKITNPPQPADPILEMGLRVFGREASSRDRTDGRGPPPERHNAGSRALFKPAMKKEAKREHNVADQDHAATILASG